MMTATRLQLKALAQASGKLFEVQRRLSQAGFKAWLAGGCVRDAILGRVPSDFDLVTDASVEQIQKIFPKTVPVGASFGVVLVLHGGEEFEIAQFRKESDYKDGRRPSLVEAATPEEDAFRRDLTVNALFYDPETQTLYDFVDGQKDIRARILRAVGDANVRFQEDHLRILRAIRFKAQLGFEWDPALDKAILQNRELLKKVSRERVREELLKMGRSAGRTAVSDFLVNGRIVDQILPGLVWNERKLQTLEFQGDMNVWFEWGLWARLSGNPNEKVLAALATLRLSNDENKTLQNFLFWFDGPVSWQNERLGVLVERGYQPGSQEGLATWIRIFSATEMTRKLQDIWNKHPQAPAPWIKAADFQGLSGRSLGQALREAYYRQLEGLDSTREEALKRLKSSGPD